MIAVANLIAIFRKELQSYFSSPFSYIIAAVFWLVSGFFFSIALDSVLQGMAMQAQMGNSEPIDGVYEFLQGFLGILMSLLLVLLPALSMGLYAEERKQKTLELLATSPVTNWIVALGKLLGVVAFFSVLMIPIVLYEIIVFSAANPPVSLPYILVAHLGLFLLATAVLSLGMFISSLSESSILAFFLTFILVLFLWVMDAIAQRVGGWFGDILSYLSLFERYNDFIQGVFDSSSLILFASYIVLGVFLTAQFIETLRFQRS
jgi:ABC-2 type transport system permease protein